MVNGLANNAEMDDSGNCDATVVLLKRGNPGATGAILLLQGGGGLRAKPSQLEAEPTEVFVPRTKTEETSSIPGPFTSCEQAVFGF